MNDNELVYLAIEVQNEIAENYLYQRYYSTMELISNLIYNKFYAIPLERSDLLTIIYFTFYKCLKHFQMKQKMSFKNFLLLNLKWNIISYLKKYTTKNHQIVNLATQYEDYDFASKENPHLMIINNFLINYSLKLTQSEKNVLKLKQIGFSNQEIGKQLNLSYKQVDNSWQRVVLKIKKAIN